MPATDIIYDYIDLASYTRRLAVITERFGNRTQAEQLRDEAALYERTAAWINKLESEK